MAKFGELIHSDIPVLICFYANWTEQGDNGEMLNEIVSVIKDKAKVIKIEIEKNIVLASALRINESPTFVLYKKNQMLWRSAEKQTTSNLIKLIEQYY